MPEKTFFEAMIQARCPRCREGRMFAGSLIRIKEFTLMNEKCSRCELKFEVEPGFFFGAMFVSYAMVVVVSILTIFTLFLGFNDPAIWVYVSAVSGLIILLLPVIFRYSRVLFLHWFGGVRYQGSN